MLLREAVAMANGEREARPLLLGEAPSKSGDRYWMVPLSGAVGERLCTLAGIAPDPDGTRYGRFYWPLREAFECRNLIERWPGAQGRGSALPREQAAPAWAELRPTLAGRVVVLLGVRLGALAAVEVYYEWVTDVRDDMQVVMIPHPSGLNRLYNEERNRRRIGEVLREARQKAAQAAEQEEVAP